MEGDCITVGLTPPNAAALMTPIGCRPEGPLTESGGFRASGLPRRPPGTLPEELCGGGLLDDGDLDEEIADTPWRGVGRAGDRGPIHESSSGAILRTPFG